jgi:DNA-directed RNA polymerase subunit omega
MSSYSAEDATRKIGSQFELVIIAARRARELRHGSPARVESTNGPCITALREIAAGEYTKQEFLNNLHKDRQNEHHTKKSKRNSKFDSRGY